MDFPTELISTILVPLAMLAIAAALYWHSKHHTNKAVRLISRAVSYLLIILIVVGLALYVSLLIGGF